jgi:hypothetical protein
VNVFRSGNSGIDRIAPDDVGEGEGFPLFPLRPGPTSLNWESGSFISSMPGHAGGGKGRAERRGMGSCRVRDLRFEFDAIADAA